jgi:hypothetical protein
VNQLGVGLHAYGFTDGTWPKIYAYWISQGALLLYGLVLSWSEAKSRQDPKADSVSGASEKTAASHG